MGKLGRSILTPLTPDLSPSGKSSCVSLTTDRKGRNFHYHRTLYHSSDQNPRSVHRQHYNTAIPGYVQNAPRGYRLPTGPVGFSPIVVTEDLPPVVSSTYPYLPHLLSFVPQSPPLCRRRLQTYSTPPLTLDPSPEPFRLLPYPRTTHPPSDLTTRPSAVYEFTYNTGS